MGVFPDSFEYGAGEIMTRERSLGLLAFTSPPEDQALQWDRWGVRPLQEEPGRAVDALGQRNGLVVNDTAHFTWISHVAEQSWMDVEDLIATDLEDLFLDLTGHSLRA